ncbi:MAG: MBL fold metallo-hydrolase [Gemmatimonadales bacterium]|nr:MBL fold metallo-hydrolase [Gemmatimonadales bacterium]
MASPFLVSFVAMALAPLPVRAPSPAVAPARAAAAPVRLTVLVDAFGEPSALRRDWGFAMLVEHDGRRILFDTGNDAEVLAHNAAALGVDLTRLDAVVISHRHGDHTDGLRHIRAVHPSVRVFAPADEAFGGETPPFLYRRPVPDLPAEQRYFGGTPPAKVPHGSAWRGLNLELVPATRELFPGVRLVVSAAAGREAPAGADLPELALALDTPEGQVLLVGCAHPGLPALLAAAEAPGRGVALLAGGFHWAPVPDAAIASLAAELPTRWRVMAVAPGHCTSEPGFAALRRVYGARYRFAGLGTRLMLGPS